VLKLSQSLMERYLSAAKTIARIAVGTPPPAGATTYRVAGDAQQHDRVGDLPFGTRGGILVRHMFPQTAEYDIKVEVSGAANLRDRHQLEIAIDGAQVRMFSLAPKNAGGGPDPYAPEVDGKLEVRVPVTGGAHDVAATFHRKPSDLLEQVREPFQNPRISG